MRNLIELYILIRRAGITSTEQRIKPSHAHSLYALNFKRNSLNTFRRYSLDVIGAPIMAIAMTVVKFMQH